MHSFIIYSLVICSFICLLVYLFNHPPTHLLVDSLVFTIYSLTREVDTFEDREDEEVLGRMDLGSNLSEKHVAGQSG